MLVHELFAINIMSKSQLLAKITKSTGVIVHCIYKEKCNIFFKNLVDRDHVGPKNRSSVKYSISV